MHRYYCTAPGCRGHHSRWQRCDLQRAFRTPGEWDSPFQGFAQLNPRPDYVDGQGMVVRGVMIPGGEEGFDIEWV